MTSGKEKKAKEGKENCKCTKCGKRVNKFKFLRKLDDGFFCINCYREKRKDHREYLKRNILGIRKREDILKECEERRKLNPPEIKGAKSGPHRSCLSISGVEKNILFKKFIKIGFSEAQARDRIEGIAEHLHCLIDQLKNQKKTEKEINQRFKEEFAKLCMETESNISIQVKGGNEMQ